MARYLFKDRQVCTTHCWTPELLSKINHFLCYFNRDDFACTQTHTCFMPTPSSAALELFSLTSQCGRKSQCHSWLVLTLAHQMSAGYRSSCFQALPINTTTAMSRPFTSSSWTIVMFSALLSSAGGAWFSGWLRREWSKSSTFVLKLSRRPRRGGRMSQTNHDRQFKWRGEKRRRWKRKRKTAGLGWWKGSGHREGKE